MIAYCPDSLYDSFSAMANKLLPLLAPKYWPIWCVVGLVRLLIVLPLSWQFKLGRYLGSLLQRIPSRGQQAAKINIKLCFPDFDAFQQRDLFKKSFSSVGMAVFETALGWWASSQKLSKLKINITGLDNLTSALQQGKGVLLCSPHFITLELTGRIFAEKIAMGVMYRPQKNALFEYITRRALDNHYDTVIPNHDIRTMVQALKNNEIVWYAPDIDAGKKHGVFVPFFGVQASTLTATSRFAKMTGAAIIPAFFYRNKNNDGYDIVLKPSLNNFPSEDLITDAARVNQVFEQAIRIAPEQYLWQYKRFKTRPPGEKKLYQ